jgi:hypothetical protein
VTVKSGTGASRIAPRHETDGLNERVDEFQAAVAEAA